jgi:predicted nucleotidyltransferase
MNKKTIFPTEYQEEIWKKVKKFIAEKILPDENIIEIVVTGSMVTKQLGEYDKKIVKPFYERKFSDIDLLISVKKDFKPKEDWQVLRKSGEPSEIGNTSSYILTWIDDKFPVVALVFEKSIEKAKGDVVLYKK